jgi:hypothetical protein
MSRYDYQLVSLSHNQLPLDGNSLHPPRLAAAYDNDEVKGWARIQIHASSHPKD